MLKNITGTFFTRILVSVLNFAIIILTARLMGAEARGSISLCMLAIAVAGLINEIVGGPAVVYFVPRYKNSSIARFSYIWAVAIGVLCSFFMGLFNFYDFTLFPLVCVCSVLLCTGSIHQFILLGHKRISAYNFIALVQSLILFGVFMSLILMKQYQIQTYFYALLAAYAVSFLTGLYYTAFVWKNNETVLKEPSFKILFNNGLLTQIASFTHLMSSRLTFYCSGHFLSMAFLGVLSTAVSITEAAMLFSTSVALVTASSVANETDKDKAAQTTLKLIKFSFLISIGILTVLALFPESLMSAIFGKDFKGIKIIVFTLIPGALAGSISQIISHYYSGSGRFKINTTVGFISLTVSALACIFFLKTKSVLLPGLIITVSAMVAMLYLVRLFLKDNQWKLIHLLPSVSDMKLLIHKFKNQS